MLFFWYCFDDWAAAAAGAPWVGEIPWIAVLLAHLLLPVAYYAGKR